MVEPAHGLHLPERVRFLFAFVYEHPLERDVHAARVGDFPGEEDVGESALAELLLDLEAAALDGDLLGREHGAAPVAHHLHQALRREEKEGRRRRFQDLGRMRRGASAWGDDAGA